MAAKAATFVCKKCREPPADGGKLRHCKGCRAAYCGVECQRADWDLHKLDRGLHSFQFLLNLSSSVHRKTQLDS
jgi:hypothetical protein